MNCIISLASNFDQESNLHSARELLALFLSSVSLTEAIWTEPFHKKAASRNNRQSLYLNQLAYAETALTADELQRKLKNIEQHLGRTNEERSQGIVRIDLDLLLYGQQRYHLNDWERPYVKQLLR